MQGASTLPKTKNRFKPRDLGTDKSDRYNRIHGTQICNNHMLERYLRNREELQRMGLRPSEPTDDTQ